MPDEMSREIQKLDTRLERFLKNEEAFVSELRGCLDKFTELHEKMATKRFDRRKSELAS